MKTKSYIKLLLLITGTLLYNFMFWQENLGINLLLFSIYIVLSIFWMYPESRKRKPVLVTAFCVILTAGMVVYHNSGIGKFGNIVSVFVLTGFAMHSQLNRLLYAFGTTVGNYFMLPVFFMRKLSGIKERNSTLKKAWVYIRLIVFPALAVFVFFMIYKTAVPIFDKFTGAIGDGVSNAFNLVFGELSAGRVWFIFFGFVLLAGIFLNSGLKKIAGLEQSQFDVLERTKRHKLRSTNKVKDGSTIDLIKRHRILSLLNEYRTGLMVMVSLNVLLLVVNIIDIQSIWFGFNAANIADFTQMVHQGTYLLILSILLAMAILLHFFRGNINFYKKNKKLKLLANIWLIQNAIMTISVAIRNFHYIEYFGLAYNRIGVVVFLLLTLFGLLTLYIKIRDKKTIHYMFRVNGWAVYLSIIALSLVNWDVYILKFNIDHSKRNLMNVPYMLNLSDKTLHIVDQNPDLFDHPVDEYYNSSFSMSKRGSYKHFHTDRVIKFMKRKENTSWLSWNYAEHIAYEYFKEKQRKKKQQNKK